MADETDEIPAEPEEAPKVVDDKPEEGKDQFGDDIAPCKLRKPADAVLVSEARKGDFVPTPVNCELYRYKDDGKVEEPPPPPITSRDFRIYKAMNSKEWGSVCECHGTKDQAVMDLLAITITTVMLLSINHGDIKPDQLRWTANCLENVRDDNGQIPPNIRCILNLIYTKIPKEDGEEEMGAPPPPPAEEEA